MAEVRPITIVGIDQNVATSPEIFVDGIVGLVAGPDDMSLSHVGPETDDDGNREGNEEGCGQDDCHRGQIGAAAH
jgi:hypothetical protein